MKKLFISALLLGAGLLAHAQLVDVAAISKVNLPDGVKADVSTISPDGSFVVLSDLQKAGLSKLDLATNTLSKVADNGSSLDLKISDDGSSVIFRQSTTEKNHLRYTALKCVDIASGKESTIVSPSRDFQGFAVNGQSVTAVEKSAAKTKSIGSAKAVATPVASINRGQLCVTVNGKTTTISPQGTSGQSYLWPAISPDGTKVVYYLATMGCYVCNLDGSNPVPLGMLRAACWLDDNTVVGMNDADDGHFVTSSCIIASSIDGLTKQQLTDDSVKAMFPSVNKDGSKISFTTPAGDLYIIDINK